MEAFPLHWPVGYKRTKYRERSPFKQTMDASQRFLRDEIRRLGADRLIVSTNIPVRKDGGLYYDYMNRKLDDPGVAIYFRYQERDISMCCDKYLTVWENIYALGKGIEALRGMDRWGVSDFVERAFTGFTALPETAGPGKAKKEWWQVLGYNQRPGKQPWDVAGIEAQYKSLAKRKHPDAGGTKEEFQELIAAYEDAKKYVSQ